MFKTVADAPTTSWWDSVLRRACTSIVRLYSCVSELMLLSSSTMMPPPSTVSIVRASRFGVSASKSCTDGLWALT